MARELPEVRPELDELPQDADEPLVPLVGGEKVIVPVLPELTLAASPLTPLVLQAAPSCSIGRWGFF